jgi:pimeloyl-ACP methyl ester carboxylesterase
MRPIFVLLLFCLVVVSGCDATAQNDLDDEDATAQDDVADADASVQDDPADSDVTAQGDPADSDATAQDDLVDADATAQDDLADADATAQDDLADDDATAQDDLADADATAQDDLADADAPAQGQPTNSANVPINAVPSGVSARRALQTQAVLYSEGLARDRSGLVSSSRCSEGQEQLIGLSTPPLCDELKIESLGTTYRGFLFSKGHRVLVIYHEGHQTCGWNWTFADTFHPDAAWLIANLLERADVLYFDMPLVATNCGQEIEIGGTVFSGENHNWFALLDKPGQSSLAYFVNHIYRALDFLGPTYTTVHMVGRSGGGWATTIYAALDWRITRSVSVAGSLPIELRLPQIDGRDDLGDWEQYGAYLYRLVSYQDLYEAAGGTEEPRRHVQLYNEYDNCCFSGAKGNLAAHEYAESAKDYMKQRVEFLVNVDDWTHDIPVELVLAELFDP